MQGTVKWFNDSKGYGYITGEGGKEDIFVHQSSIVAEGFKTLRQGERVKFEISEERGRQAVKVRRAY